MLCTYISAIKAVIVIGYMYIFQNLCYYIPTTTIFLMNYICTNNVVRNPQHRYICNRSSCPIREVYHRARTARDQLYIELKMLTSRLGTRRTRLSEWCTYLDKLPVAQEIQEHRLQAFIHLIEVVFRAFSDQPCWCHRLWASSCACLDDFLRDTRIWWNAAGTDW